MSKTTQENVLILLKVIKRHEEKRPEGIMELKKLKTNRILLIVGFRDIGKSQIAANISSVGR